MTTAIINPNDTLYTNWSSPVCISGPQGAQGATGPAGNPGRPGSMGPAGIPGSSIIVIYCGGASDSPDADLPATQTDAIPDGWSETIADSSWDSSTDPDYSLATLWALQGKIVYENSAGTDYHYEWQSKPYVSNGSVGATGQNGKDAQVIYPAGVYNVNTTYVTTDKVAPYVLDETDGNYYVLNNEMTWIGTQHDNLTPHEDYAINDGRYWLKFDGFNAIFAKIGIIANGLIGSAVFNGDWMFSQQGINRSGALTTDYQNFNASNPMSSNNEFRPNIAINFKTGEVYMAHGNFYCDENGNVTIKGITAQGGVFSNSDETITLPEVPANTSTTLRYTFKNITRASVTKHIVLGDSPDTIIQVKKGDNYLYCQEDMSDCDYTLPYGIGYIEFVGINNGAATTWYIKENNFGLYDNSGSSNGLTPAYSLTPYIMSDKVISNG